MAYISRERLAELWDKSGEPVTQQEAADLALLTLQERHERAAPRKSLRDEFAIAALTGLMASPATDGWSWATIASNAYGAAQAMMDERAKPKETA